MRKGDRTSKLGLAAAFLPLAVAILVALVATALD
jgi:hypothetical protein